MSTCDLYVPDTHFHKTAQDPVDIIISGSICHFEASTEPPDTSVPLPRDVPSSRKEGAVIVFIERTSKPLVSATWNYTFCRIQYNVMVLSHRV